MNVTSTTGKAANVSAPAVTVATKDVVTFDAANALFGTPNAKRERKNDRTNRVKALLTTPLTFLSPLGLGYAKMIRDGQTIDIAGSKVSRTNLEPLRCVICAGIHGQPTKDEQVQGDGIKAERLQHTELYLQNGKLVAFSETCVKQYLRPNATKASMTNFDKFAEYHGIVQK